MLLQSSGLFRQLARAAITARRNCLCNLHIEWRSHASLHAHAPCMQSCDTIKATVLQMRERTPELRPELDNALV